MLAKQTSFAGFWQVLLAAILWGTIGVATQFIYSSEDTNSLFLNLMRTSLATPILLLLGWRTVGRGMFRIPRRDLGLMAFAGLILAVSHACYFASIRYCGVTIATLLTICVSPVLVSIMAVALGIEPFSRQLVIALLCALSGAILLVGWGDDGARHLNTGLGVIFALLSALTYSGMILCGRLLANRYHPLQTTSIMFAAGALLLLLLNLASGITVPQKPSVWLAMIYLAVFPTALAYTVFHQALRSVPATAASIISMLDPVVAALLAWWLFGENLSWLSFGGAGLLLCGIFLLMRKAAPANLTG